MHLIVFIKRLYTRNVGTTLGLLVVQFDFRGPGSRVQGISLCVDWRLDLKIMTSICQCPMKKIYGEKSYAVMISSNN